MALAIKVENLSKAYQLGEIGTGTLSRDLERWLAKIRGKEDPFLQVGETNDRTSKGTSDVVWSLKDINFEIKEGDAVGIIGRNGAGKSTLLKLLSRVTSPTTGNFKVKGRIASLLEVGTGFHPELTGRENIYLNGAILGMRKKEIKRKFDEIVDFSGVERYVDTPVKRYSSGMYVRLAFAVAAHLESEILIVDEVLAVGDAEFQKKCLGKMGDVSKEEGRTILFVSHNIAAIQILCNSSVVLRNGMIDFMGTASQGIDYYLVNNSKKVSSHYVNKEPMKGSDMLEIKVIDQSFKERYTFRFTEPIIVTFRIRVKSNFWNQAVLGIRVKDQTERNIFSSELYIKDVIDKEGEYTLQVNIPSALLVPNTYNLVVGYHIPNKELIKVLDTPVSFEIEETGTNFAQYNGNDYGCVFVNCKWELNV